LEEKADEERITAFPLSLYAAQNWADHANFENVASHIQNAMEDLFNPKKPHLQTWNQIHIVEEYKIPVNEFSPTFALHFAAFYGFHDLAKQLIITHALDVNGKGYLDMTPLDAASRGGHVDVARVLLDNGADVNACDAHHQTPLYRATNRGHLKFVQLLLEHGANVNIQTNNKYTPLHAASDWGRLEIARLLLDHGADVQIQASDGSVIGSTPLQLATHWGYHDTAQLLLDHGAERE
jgi:ankyrin repeat protein